MANIFSHITNILNTDQTFRSITISKKTKVFIQTLYSLIWILQKLTLQ